MALQLDPIPISGKEPQYPNPIDKNAPSFGKRICHIHIPKCAGNSIYRAIRNAIAPANRIHFPVMESIAAAREVKWGLNWHDFQNHYLECRQYMLQLYLHQGWHIISGHLPFSPLGKNFFKDKYAFITVLREPIPRFISNIIYLVFRHGKYSTEAYNQGEADPCEEIETLLNDEISYWIAREYCIYLGGLNYECKGDVDAARELAIYNLDHLDLIGFQSQIPQFEKAFEQEFGVSLHVGVKNKLTDFITNPKLKERVYALFETPQRKAQIEKLCADDSLIYDRALKKLNAKKGQD